MQRVNYQRGHSGDNWGLFHDIQFIKIILYFLVLKILLILTLKIKFNF